MTRSIGPVATIAILMAAESVSALEVTMIYAALPKLAGVFEDRALTGWFVTGFMLMSAASAAICGRLGDLYGRRRVLLIVLAIATFGSLISALSREGALILAGRTIQGVSGAILPLCYGLVRERVPGAHVALGVGFVGGTATICAGAGLILGGLIIDHGDWPLIFQFCTALGVVAFLVVSILPASDAAPSRPSSDLLGGLLFAPAVFAILLAITQAGRVGWLDQSVLALAASGMALLGAWVWRELSHPSPLIDVRLFSVPAIGLGNAIFATLGLGAMQVGFIISILGQQDSASGAGLNLGAAEAGLLLLPANIAGAIAAPLVSKLIGPISVRGVIMSGAAIICLSYIGLAANSADVTAVVALLVAQGVGLAFVYIGVPIAIVAAAPPDRTSEATGVLSVTRAAAMGVGAQIVASFLYAAGEAPNLDAYRNTFLFVSACGAFGLAAAALLPRARPHLEPAIA